MRQTSQAAEALLGGGALVLAKQPGESDAAEAAAEELPACCSDVH
jgi:hypothetical protein